LPVGATCSPTQRRLHDTTSLSFEGRGGESWSSRPFERLPPDLHQMIVGLVMDQDGRRCAASCARQHRDVTTLLPVVDRLRASF